MKWQRMRVKWYNSRSFMYKYLIKLQVPTTKGNGLPKKKKATSKKATPSPKKTDEKLKPKTKENKQMRFFFLFLSHLPTLKIPIGLYAG